MRKSQMAAAMMLSLGTISAIAADGRDTTLYGSLAQGVQYHSKVEKNSHMDYLNDHLRIGVKGTEALGGNNQLFFNLYLTSEENKDGSGLNGVREAHIGVQGDFGRLTLGKQKTAWKTYMVKSVFDDAAIGIERLGKMIRYDLEDIGGSGFSFAVDGVLDGKHEVIKSGRSRGFNEFSAAVGYKNNTFAVSAGYEGTSGNGIKTKLGGSTDAIMGASAAVTLLRYDDKSPMLEWALDAQHHAHFGEYASTSLNYTWGAHQFRGGWEGIDYDKEKFWQQYHLGHIYKFSERTDTELKGTYRKQGDDDEFIGKLTLHHAF